MSNQSNFNTVLYTHVCALCGKTFQDHHNKTKFCEGPHYRTCEAVIDGRVCGKQFEIKNPYSKTRTCCRSHATILTHTPAADAARSKSIKHSKKFDESVKRRSQYLSEHPEEDTRLGTDFFKKAMLNKYGDESPARLDFVKRKKIETTRKHYGVDNPMQDERIKMKKRQNEIANKNIIDDAMRSEESSNEKD